MIVNWFLMAGLQKGREITVEKKPLAREHDSFIHLAPHVLSRILIAAPGTVMPIKILAAPKASVSAMPMSSGSDAQKRPEAAFLRVVKTVVERLCRIGKFFQLFRA
ncbi:MAG: hypothetical protein ACREDJ_07525, partial [Methylocella sp.]